MFKNYFPLLVVIVLIGCSSNEIKMGYGLSELNKTLNTELVLLSGDDNISIYLYSHRDIFSVFSIHSQYGLYEYSTHIRFGQNSEEKFKEIISQYNKKYGNSLYDEEKWLFYWTNTKNKLPNDIIELWVQMTDEDITILHFGNKFIEINQNNEILHN